MTSDRDPQVGALLDTIEPVPARPGFWQELEQRLAQEAPVLDLARVPSGDGHRRRRLVVSLAAAALLAVALGGLLLRDDRDATETVPVQPGPSVTAPTQTTGTSTPDAPDRQAIAYLQQWIRSVVEGDTTHGWDLLGPQSQESLGSPAVYAQSLESYRASWGTYANVDASAARIGDGDAFLVLVRRPSGDPQPLTAVVQLSPAGPNGHVEPFLPGPALNLIQMAGLPGAEGSVGPGDQVPLALDADAGIAVLIDGVPVPDEWLVRGTSGAVTGVRLPGTFPSGTHLIAVAQQTSRGVLAMDARAFQVA